MLKLNASYSKKVPSDAKFSSESYLACIEVELPTGMTTSELNSKIHETFDLVKQSVESEIKGRTTSVAPVKQQRSPARPETSAETATNKQIGFILKLGKERQKGLPELNAMAATLLKAESIYQLTKRDASAMVDQLKLAAQLRKKALDTSISHSSRSSEHKPALFHLMLLFPDTLMNPLPNTNCLYAQPRILAVNLRVVNFIPTNRDSPASSALIEQTPV